MSLDKTTLESVIETLNENAQVLLDTREQRLKEQRELAIEIERVGAAIKYHRILMEQIKLKLTNLIKPETPSVS